MENEQKDEILKMKTIHTGQFDDLVSEDKMTRIWVSRCEEGEDGRPLVSIENLINGNWVITSKL
jgi:hypothetical protein